MVVREGVGGDRDRHGEGRTEITMFRCGEVKWSRQLRTQLSTDTVPITLHPSLPPHPQNLATLLPNLSEKSSPA